MRTIRYMPPWPALACVSLLGGCVLWLMCVSILYVPETGVPDPEVLRYGADALEVGIGKGEATGEDIAITLDERGAGAVLVPVERASATGYPYLHVHAAVIAPEVAVTILWQRAGADGRMHRHEVRHGGFGSLWVSMEGVRGWRGGLRNLGVGLQGEPGSTVVLRSITLRPPSLRAFLGATLSEWTLFRPWQQASINAYTGSGTPGPAIYPTPAAAALLVLSLLVYGALWLLLRRRTALDWRVAAALGLTCWVVLDLPWQSRLWQQLGETRETFAGKTGNERRLAAPDGALYAFVSDVREAVADPASRVFLATGSDYLGVRGAYHLFPMNVFWRRHGPELPDPQFLRAGDYILVYAPRAVRYHSNEGVLRWPDGNEVAVDELMLRPNGGLFRVQ